jgi:hypothetical protein
VIGVKGDAAPGMSNGGIGIGAMMAAQITPATIARLIKKINICMRRVI